MDIHVKLTIDDRIIDAGRWIARRVTRRRVALALAACTLGAAVVWAAPVDRPHTFGAGDPIKASEINDSFDVIYDELNARVIRSDQTIEVADCDALGDALALLQDKTISMNAMVTIELPEGTFDCAATLYVDHRDGSHIAIVGAGSGATTLEFFNKHGVVVSMGRSLGLIDKLTLNGSGGGGDGLLVEAGATARAGADLVVREFAEGVYVEGGFLYAAGVRSEDNARNGFQVNVGGKLVATSAQANDNAISGFSAVAGSTIVATDAQAANNVQFGFNANVGSSLYGENMVATNCLHGFDANNNSVIAAVGGTSTGGTRGEYGFAAWNDSMIDARSASANDQTLEGFTARDGSFLLVSDPGGNDVTYFPGTTFYADERSMVFLKE